MRIKKRRGRYYGTVNLPLAFIRAVEHGAGLRWMNVVVLFLLLLGSGCSGMRESRLYSQMLDGLPAAAYDSSSGQAPQHSYRHVLLLNSYHPGYDWTDDVTAGVQSVLNLTDSDIDLHTEYMDTKSVDDPDYLEYLFTLYQKKFTGTRFDAVIAVDDDAFRFALRYRQQLFPHVPLVFCGVTDFEEDMLAGQKDITGLIEQHEHLKTIDLALRLHPQARKLVVITDSTTTGVIHRRHLDAVARQLERPVETVFLADQTMDELEEYLSETSSETVIYLTGFNRDRDGIVFNSTEALYRLSKVTQSPLYSYKYAYLGNGIVGGYITWGFTHGEAAAVVVEKILAGTAAGSIPVSVANVDPPMFDHRQLQHFGIKTADLPDDRIVVYGPDPAVSRNNAIIFGLLLFLAFESILIVIMVWNHRMRRMAEQNLRESEERYRQLVENFPDGMVMLYDNDLRCRMLGGSSLPEIGLSHVDTEGKTLAELFPDETCRAFEPHFNLSLQGTTSRFELTQHVHIYEVRSLPICDPQGNITAGMAVIQNITRRKQSEMELQVLTHELEQNEERLNLAIMGADLGLWDWDIQSGGMVYNRRWAEMLDYALEEIEPHIGFWEQIVHPDDMPRIMHAFAEHFVGKTASYDNELRMRTKSGEWKWVQARGKVVRRDENGLPLRATGTHLDITERKKVEEALRESKQNLDLAITGADLGLWDWNLETDEMIFSHNWLQMMGYNADDVSAGQQSWLQHVHPDDRDALMESIDTHTQGLVDLFEAEYRMRSKTGEWKWFFSRGRIVEFSFDGTPLRMSGTLLDVTRRQMAQEDRRQVEERLEMALNAASLGLWDIDLATGRGVCDQRFIDMLGYSMDGYNFNQDSWHSLCHPEDLPYTLEKLRQHLSGNSDTLEVETRIRTSNGDWKWVQVRASVVEWENGSPKRIVGTNLDITQKKRSEEALRSRMLALTEPFGDTSSFSFHEVFDVNEIQAIQDAFSRATGVASIIQDRDGNNITRGSNSCDMCRLLEKLPLGYENCRQTALMLAKSNGERVQCIPCGAGLLNCCAPIMVGDDCIANWIIGEIAPDDMDEEQLLAYARRVGVDEELFAAALQEMPRMPREQFEQVGVALSLIAGQLSRLALNNILQAREITRRNRSEAALRRSEARIRQLNEDLERRVCERNSELEATSRELEAFTSSISHDLHAPLRAVDSFSRILQEEYASGAVDGEAKRSVRLLRENVQYMEQLIDDLLLFSRLNRRPLDRLPIDLAAMARQVFAELAQNCDGRRIDFRLDDLPPCNADSAMMRQVLHNLISNAIKFTSKRNEGIIEMGVEYQDDKPVIFITDNGIGFDMASSDKLFGVFQRLHDSDEFPGSGMGLAFARRIIHRHGGNIWASSEAGQGATFYFSLE